MANPVGNTNAPMGLRPVGTLGSAGYTGRIEVFATSTSDSAAIGIGDPIVNTGTGDAAGVPVAKRFTTNGTTGAVISGVCVGIVPNPGDLTVGYRAASSATKILVDTDPNTIFEIADSSSAQTTSMAITDIGNNVGLVMGTVDTTTGNGKTVLGTTIGTTTALECKILRLSPKVGNAVGDWAKYQVIINNHQYRAGTSGL
jgi:hypothetical protein